MNTTPLFYPLLIILMVLSFSVFGWSRDCEEQYEKSIREECKYIKCLELEVGK